MMAVAFLIFLLLFQPSGQGDFSIPSDLRGLPATHLRGLSISDTSRQLNEVERKELVRLFIWAYVKTVRQTKQDYALPPDTPIYKLLKSNFPALAEQQSEGGILLGRITRFFNRFPEYETIVNSELEKRGNKNFPCGD